MGWPHVLQCLVFTLLCVSFGIIGVEGNGVAISLLPASGPYEGQTNITVAGQDFVSSVTYTVTFSTAGVESTVTAQFLSSTGLSVFSPAYTSIGSASGASPLTPSESNQNVLIEVFAEGVSINIFVFSYYENPTVLTVTPQMLSEFGGNVFYLEGNFQPPTDSRVSMIKLMIPNVNPLVLPATFSPGSYNSEMQGFSLLPPEYQSAEAQIMLAPNGVDFHDTGITVNVTKELPPFRVCWMFYNKLDNEPGWTYATNQGRLMLEAEFGRTVESLRVDEVRGYDAAQAQARAYADQDCKIIFGTHVTHTTINYVLPNTTDIKFVMSTPSTDTALNLLLEQPNVGLCFPKLFQARYLAGMVAGYMTESNVIGYVVSFPFPQTTRQLNAFALGVRRVNPNAKVVLYYSKDWNSDFIDVLGGNLLLRMGADVVSQHTNGLKLGALFRDNGKWSIGQWSDYSVTQGDQILVSALNVWGPCYIHYTRQIMQGTFKTDFKFMGIDEDSADISAFNSRVPLNAKAEVLATYQSFKFGFEIFCGPIVDNQGNISIPEGKCLDNKELDSSEWMSFYVEGVENRGDIVRPNCGEGNYSRFNEEFEFVGCEVCPPGSFSTGTEDVLECQPCPVGYFSQVGICQRCPEGTYAANESTAVCTGCEPGYHQELEGQSSCVPCKPGYFASGYNSIQCQPCPGSQFNPHPAADSCLPCPENSVSSFLAATTADACVCDEGFFSLSNDTFPPCGTCPGVETSVTAAATRRGEMLLNTCERLRTCIQVEERSHANVRVTHVISESSHPELSKHQCENLQSYLDLPVTGEKNASQFEFSVASGDRLSRVYEANVTESELGPFAMDIFVGGVLNQDSPIFIELVEFSCPVSQTVKIGPNGFFCDTVSSDSDSDTVTLIVIVVVVVAIVVGLGIVAGFLYMRRFFHDHSWKIKAEEIQIPDNPEVLGRGTFGLVVKATHRGTPVAIKRVIPFAPGAAASFKKSKDSATESQATPKTGMAGVSFKRYANLGTGYMDNTMENFTQLSQGNEKYKDVDSDSHQRDSHQRDSNSQRDSGTLDRNSTGGSAHNFDGVNYRVDDDKTKKSRDAGGSILEDVEDDHVAIDVSQHDDRSSAGLTQGSTRANDMQAIPAEGREATPIKTSGMAASFRMKKSTVAPAASQMDGSATAALAVTPKIGRGTSQSSLKARNKELYEQFKKEMEIVVYLRHPNITMVIGAVVENEKEPIMVMELMEHSALYDIIHNDTVEFDATMIVSFLRDIVAGMVYLHAASPPVLHNDLKAGNVLVDDHFRAKIADFGLSMKKSSGMMIGTPFWMAPELLRGEPHTTKTDVYAFGILMFELFARAEPFENENAINVLKWVADIARPEEYRPISSVFAELPMEVMDLMKECWNKNPMRRPTFKEIAQRIEELPKEKLEHFLSLGNKTGTNVHGPSVASKIRKGPSSSTQNEELLYQVFPKRIADDLKQGKKVAPEHHPIVTIFFSDIVGFTDISRQLQPLEVMNMLDRLYSKLDALANECKVFKVETIGDAYMAVTNLINPQADHTLRICDFAVMAMEAANSTRVLEGNKPVPRGLDPYVHLRVGFHSGPVVASVVGNLNPRYCLFGDTVNTSSRMESNSEKDSIHFSEAACNLLLAQDPQLESCVIPRGTIQVKGKGEMKTFWAKKDGYRKTRAARLLDISKAAERESNQSCFF